MTTASVIFDGRPARVDMFFTASATFNGTLSFIDAGGDPLDMSALTLEAAVVRSSAGTLATPTLDQSDKANGNIGVSFTTADTTNVLGVHNARWYVRDTLGNIYLDGFVTAAPIGESGIPRWSTGETVTVLAQTYTGALTGGETDHGELDGLADDDHTQYLNIARGEYQSSVLAAVANAGAPLVGFDHFAAHDDGTIHAETTIGHGTGDPITWGDGLVGSPLSEPFLETCEIVSGVLRHRGTRLAAAASQLLPTTATRRTVSVAWADPTFAGLAPVPFAGEGDEYASLRLNFIDIDASNGDGYVCYVEQASQSANHFVKIVRDDNQNPTGNDLVGPIDLGRRLEDGEVLTFGYFDNTYFAMVGGAEICRVTEDTYDPSTFDSTGIVLNCSGDYLPGAYWWSMSDGIPAVIDANTTNTTATALAATVAEGYGPPIIAAARCNDADVGTPLARFNRASVSNSTHAAGTFIGYYCSGPAATLTELQIEVTSAAGAGEVGYVGCYEVLADGGPGEQLWVESFSLASVGQVTKTGLSYALPARRYIVFLNPTGNSSAALKSAYPNEQHAAYWGGNIDRAGTWSNTAGAATLPADLTSYTIATSSSTGTRLRLIATSAPIVMGRA